MVCVHMCRFITWMIFQGGLITALTVVERPQLITGIVLSAPALLDDRATSFQVSLVKASKSC